MIDRFDGNYRWLSNFTGGVEQKYQAAKCVNPHERDFILKSTPSQAKRLGRTCEMREDWLEIRLHVMAKLVREKFSKEPYRSLLLATGDEELVECNWWGDKFWGVDVKTREGQNNLGKILMMIRQELRDAG